MKEYGIAEEHKLPGQGTVDWLRIRKVLHASPRLQNIRNECSRHGFSTAEICRTCDELLPDFSS